MTNPPEITRWTAKRKAELVKEIIKGTTTVAEAARTYGLTPAEIERWRDDALMGMENALRVNPKDIQELYEKKTKDLHSAYGEAMLQIKFLKNLKSRTSLYPDGL